MKDSKKEILPRNTLRNFLNFLFSGNFREIFKILRRRFINIIKFIKTPFAKILGIYYNHPSVIKRRQKRQLKHILHRFYLWKKGSNTDTTLKIAVILRDGNTYPKSSAFIRLISPLADRKIQKRISFELYPENTTSLSATDICIIQRNAFDDPEKAKKLVSNLRAANTKLVLDSDDAFHSIDREHPEHDIHKATLDAFNYLVRQADQLWLSTPRLASFLKRMNSSIVIVRNSLDPRLWTTSKTPVSKVVKGPIQMLYMGTVSHDSDFDMIFPALDKIAYELPGSFKLTVIGVSSSLPERDWIERIYQKRGVSIYPRFVNWFLKQGPYDIGLSPLIDSEFNHGKSDIKCLDYLAAGMRPIVSDIEPYQSAELKKYIIKVENTESAWEKQLREIVLAPAKFRAQSNKLIPEAQAYIWRKRSSKATAKQIYKLLTDLKKS